MKQMIPWFEDHRDWALEFLRMALGAILIWKGLAFLGDMDALLSLIGFASSSWAAFVLGHYIVFAHIVGGLFVMVGMLTRWSTAAQIPILAGAVVTLLLQSGSVVGSEIQFTMLVFALLVTYLFYGGGRLSIDGYLEGRTGASDALVH